MVGRPRLPSRLRRMRLEEAAYMSGIFDGEESFWLRGDDTAGHRRLNVSNQDPEIISACFRFTGAGGVGITIINDNKLCLQWLLVRQAEIEDFLWQIKPYSARAEGMLQKWLKK